MVVQLRVEFLFEEGGGGDRCGAEHRIGLRENITLQNDQKCQKTFNAFIH